jgi:hypothetical protein
MVVVGKRTMEDYQEFKDVDEELDSLEKTMWRLEDDVWIHNHINDAVRKVDEGLISELVNEERRKMATGLYDSVEDFITWMYSWKDDKRIIDNLNPDEIYHSFLDTVEQIKKKLPSVMDKVGKLKMDKSNFERCVLSLTMIGGGVGESQDKKTVHYLYSTVGIIPKLERLANSLKLEFH